jgi:hypothetical protein
MVQHQDIVTGSFLVILLGILTDSQVAESKTWIFIRDLYPNRKRNAIPALGTGSGLEPGQKILYKGTGKSGLSLKEIMLT